MNEISADILYPLFGAKSATEVEVIQSLWSGYGKISRLALNGGDPATVIAKNIRIPNQSNHPRGWNTDRSHLRKMKSYVVEVEWYQQWAQRCDAACRVPTCYRTFSNGDEHLILLEDLDATGFPVRKSSLNKDGVQLGLSWLAHFHATFINEAPGNLWPEGTYWHLATRPDEFEAMAAGPIKDVAQQLDETLSNCQFKTLVHGDAKVANFCFSEDLQRVAALDFQYVGGGCGMKDVAYFLGSCISDVACEEWETELLDFYFAALRDALNKKGKTIDFDALEQEWRRMYSIAWSDFTRFLLGWMPTHQKINRYSLDMVDRALEVLDEPSG